MFISSNNKKTFWRWWFLATAIYLILAAVITWRYGIGFLMPVGDDTGHHIQLAKNLIEYRTFSLDGLDGAYSAMPPRPTNYLTPGYAFWLALIYLIFKSFTPAIFIGAIVFAFSAPLTYFLVREITENNKIAFWSALIFMIEPLSIYHSGLMFTEQLFVPLFLAACYGFVKYLKTGDRKFVFGSLFIFSLSTLVRPIIFYLLPLLFLMVFIKEFKISWRRAAISGLLSLIVAYSLVGGWLVRNKIILNTWQISSNQGAILAAHYGVLNEYLKNRPNYIEPKSPNIRGLNTLSVEYNKIVEEFALKEILNHKISYFKIYLGYTSSFFVRSGYDNLVSRLAGWPALSGGLRTALTLKFLSGDIFGAVQLFFQAPATIWITFFGASIWIAINILAIIGFFYLMRKKSEINKPVIFYCAFLPAYFALVSSIFSVARYRLPVNPFIFIFASSGFLYLREKFKNV